MNTASYSREYGARQNERLQIARNALKMSMSFDDIMKLTGLPLEEVEALQTADL